MTAEEIKTFRKTFESQGLPDPTLAFKIKQKAAELLAELEQIKIPDEDHIPARAKEISTMFLESCVMWAIKAISKQPQSVSNGHNKS